MEVITSHVNLDFDGFASMIAAKKLYPNAYLVLPNVISKDVRDFLTLYRSFFDLREFKEINLGDVTKLIIVDTSSLERVMDFKSIINNKSIPKIIYDHHVEERSIIAAQKARIEKMGACTSIILKEIMEKGIEVRPFESTILALGIYTDTNCLTFSSTTVEDAKAVAFLLQCGAYLDVISNFIGQPLSSKQKNAFDEFNRNLQIHVIKGFQIGISIATFDEYIDEVAYITHRILSLSEYDAVICVAVINNRIYIVGRSQTKKINMNQIMKNFDGSGHTKAGSAKVKNCGISQVKEKLLEVLEVTVEPSVRAKDIASFPVKTVSEDISLDEANNIMLRYGHSGMPVTRDDNVVGMVTRRDIEKAIQHGYGHSPVKAYMSKKFLWVAHDTSIKEIQNKLIENNIGRLPVFENGKLIGIVTRTDILRQIFGDNSPTRFKQLFVEDNKKIYKKDFSENIRRLENEVKDILLNIGKLGDESSNDVYVVGGFVRDLVLGNKNHDIDIVVVGDGIKLAEEICKLYAGKIKIHTKFETASVEILDKYKIDVVTARREFYEFPAALPIVEKGSIKTDLYRRDFTINCMAIVLNQKDFGTLIDYFGGQKDLQERLVRVLYNMSFVEDPTRILRAIRFSTRYDFDIEEDTLHFLTQALDMNFLEKVSNERISDELLMLLKEKNAYKPLMKAIEMGIYRKLYPTLNINDDTINIINKAAKMEEINNCDKILLYLLILFINTKPDYALTLTEKMKLTKNYKDIVLNFVKNKDLIIRELNKSKISNYEIYLNLSNMTYEELLLLKNFTTDEIAQNIEKYLAKLKNIKIQIDGKTLKEMGINSGPKFKEIFRRVFEARINNAVNTFEDELNYVKQIINKEGKY